MVYKNKQKEREYKKRWTELHPDYHKEYVERNKERINKRDREMKKMKYNKNKLGLQWRNKYNKKHSEWEKRNKEKVNLYHRNWKHKIREIIKPKDYILKRRLRSLVRKTFNLYYKKKKVWKSCKYGINYQAIIEILKPLPEKLDNYEIHHIQPISTFKFLNENGSENLEAIKEAFKPENHKLLTIEEHKKLHERKSIYS